MLKTVTNPHGELREGEVYKLPRADAEGLVAVGKAVWHAIEAIGEVVRLGKRIRHRGKGA